MGTYESTLSIKIIADGDKPATFMFNHTRIPHGMFTTHSGNHEHEMQVGTVDGRTFNNKGNGIWVDACNHGDLGLGLNHGTEGSFEIWNFAPIEWKPAPTSDSHKIALVSWKIPRSHKSGGWSPDKPVITVETWMTGHYNVQTQGLEPYSEWDESAHGYAWSTQFEGLLTITKM